MSNRIVVPMDFTVVASNAFKYAYNMFKGEPIFVVHVTSDSLTTLDYIGLKPGETKSSVLKNELNRTICYELDTNEVPDNIEVHILKGETVPTIKEFAKAHDINTMVMGTRDKYTFFDKWLGTVSLGLVKGLELPSYLVPRYSKYEGLNKVMVASDYHLKNEAFINEICEWNKNKNAFMKFLHIQTEEGDDFKEEEETLIKELVEKADVNFGFEIESLYNKEISKTLLAAAYNFGADLMIVLPDNQNFINSLLVKSISKELILRTDIPLLFLPHKRYKS